MPYKDIQKQREANRKSYQLHKKERRDKQKEYSQKPESKERRRKRRKQIYPENREKIIKQNQLWQQKFKDKNGISFSAYKIRLLKQEIIDLLGNECSNPFNLNHGDFLTDIRCLQIDHVKGNGHFEIEKYHGGSRAYYLHILEQIKSGSKDYQLLCANCNWIKRVENKESE